MDSTQDPMMMKTPAEKVLEWNREYDKLVAERDQVFEEQVMVERRLADIEAKLESLMEQRPIV